MTQSDRACVPARHSAVVGLQWGDEGKGKVVDLMTAEHDVIVRYNGGANAGHTIVVGDKRYALHLVPSGILYPDKMCVVGNGVVVDPAKLVEEIHGLRERGVAVGDNLRVSDRAHVVMPYHKLHDESLESRLAAARTSDEEASDDGGGAGPGGLAIGTTKRGIGPAYADKIHRSTAIRMADLIDRDRLARRLEVVAPIRAAELSAHGVDASGIDATRLLDEYAELGRQLAPFVTDTTWLLHDAMADDHRILFEGANASLLDVDHGTYPYVTSSNASSLGIPAGTGLPGGTPGRIVGIMKAYATRVGAGPFPTEEFGDDADRIRERGREYGTTTGRPRRCGWLDLVALRYTTMINGVTGLAITLLDVLAGFDELKICTAYRQPDGSSTDRFRPDAEWLSSIEPVYETLPGWSEPLDDVRTLDGLPTAARAYVDRIASFLATPVDLVGVGPGRAQTITVEPTACV